MAIQRLRCAWAGAGIEGPGLTTFYSTGFATVSLPVGAVAFFNAWKQFLPEGTTISIPDGGDLIDETDGELIGTWGSSGDTQVIGTGAGSWADGVGGRVVWRTGVIRNGHRVRGQTFCTPLIFTAFGTNGDLNNTARAALQAAADAMLTAVGGEMRVWSRPGPKGPGAAVPVTTAEVPDRVAWLRSRKI